MTRFFGRSVALGLLTGAIALVILMALGLIAYQLLGDVSAIQKLTCRYGLSTQCLEDELEKKRREMRALQLRMAELEALYKRLSKLDHASESFVVFYTNRGGSHTVTSGHRYASLIEPGRFKAGWCYIDLPNAGGISRNFYIARMGSSGDVSPNHIGDESLSNAGLTRHDVSEALTRCRWPDATS